VREGCVFKKTVSSLQNIFFKIFSLVILFYKFQMEVVYNLDDFTTSLNPDNILTALGRANCLNLVHEVNYNKYGKKDEV
jgi:hypothetical protein